MVQVFLFRYFFALFCVFKGFLFLVMSVRLLVIIVIHFCIASDKKVRFASVFNNYTYSMGQDLLPEENRKPAEYLSD